MRVQLRKFFHILITTGGITTLFVLLLQQTVENDRKIDVNWRQLNKHEINNLSVLGRILFLQEKPPFINETKTYKILIWKYGKTIENRHLKNFGSKQIDPFADCSVKNCEITYKDNDLDQADLVIFHMHRMKPNDLPKNRSSGKQIWAFLTDESPHHMFQFQNNLSYYNNVFNWSMTYRMDSDIPVPYGRTIVKPTNGIDHHKNRTVLVAVMGSNCGGQNHRWKYIKELNKHIKIDIYGKCGTLKCPGHYGTDCTKLNPYLFYLAFENSNCDEYITEKLWWNAYYKNSIPILMGASPQSYRKLLPPNSYINIEEFAKPRDLADYLNYLNRTDKYLELYEWKKDFSVLNEHGYFGSPSYHYCRACEALNYNKKQLKVYENITNWWNTKKDCHPAWDS